MDFEFVIGPSPLTTPRFTPGAVSLQIPAPPRRAVDPTPPSEKPPAPQPGA